METEDRWPSEARIGIWGEEEKRYNQIACSEKHVELGQVRILKTKTFADSGPFGITEDSANPNSAPSRFCENPSASLKSSVMAHYEGVPTSASQEALVSSSVANCDAPDQLSSKGTATPLDGFGAVDEKTTASKRTSNEPKCSSPYTMLSNNSRGISSSFRYPGLSGGSALSRRKDDPMQEIDSEPLLNETDSSVAVETHRSGFLLCSRRLAFHSRALMWRLKCLFTPHSVSRMERLVALSGETTPRFFAPNIIRNQRYNLFTLVPLVLRSQFKLFMNCFYLGVAVAQFVPRLRIGPLFTYICPLSLVLTVTILKEAYDDYERYLRDREANSALYEVLDRASGRLRPTEAQYIRVGHILRLHANQRVPCDALLLRAPRPSGTTFIRTDQLDGETDWKLRRAVAATQALSHDSDLQKTCAWAVVEPPRKDIYEFVGNFCVPRTLGRHFKVEEGVVGVQDHKSENIVNLIKCTGSSSFNVAHDLENPISEAPEARSNSDARESVYQYSRCPTVVTEPLSLENTLWGGTVVTSGPAWALVLYTGSDSRAVLSASGPRTKLGVFDKEVDGLSRILFCIMVVMASVLVVMKGVSGVWFIYFIRFVLLLSAIIPISLRVNLDLAKAFYARLISRDPKLPGTVVRNSSMPEELGRIDVLLTDKTGTLTMNEMVFRKLHLGRELFTDASAPNIRAHLPFILGLEQKTTGAAEFHAHISDASVQRSSTPQRENDSLLPHAHDASFVPMVKAPLTASPTLSSNFGYSPSHLSGNEVSALASTRRLDFSKQLRRTLLGLALCHNVTPIRDELTGNVSYQASSPDEMALVSFAASAGLNLVNRTHTKITLMGPNNTLLEYDILFIFPFSSMAKRMGCILRQRPRREDANMYPIPAEGGRCLFFLKGAESVMLPRLEARNAHWLQEECDNFARTGLRTLVLAVKELTEAELDQFRSRYTAAQTQLQMRADRLRAAINSVENEMTLLALTGVEDQLQPHVPQTLESFRHAGIHTWMLTGDKMETAACVAISAGLKPRQHAWLKLSGADFLTPEGAQDALDGFVLGPTETVLVVDGPFIDMAISHFPAAFITAASQAPSVICCRCTPTQKAEITRLIQVFTGKRTAAVGDGGNDVSMIQAANCGIGIVGKEGKQASLAADFSISDFHSLHRLLLWHGRNCYQRSAKLAHFVIHRGLIIATIQVIFSSIFYFVPLALFQGWLTVGYATYYTMLPVFSLVLDVELSESVVFMFPELYDSLRRGRAMSRKTFFSWLWTSVYQGSVIMLGAILLFESDFINIISITFTSLILAELLNVASEITSWHMYMVIAHVTTFIIYLASMVLLPTYFSLGFISTALFWWKVGTITLASWVPLYCLKMVLMCLQPTRDSKLTF